MRISIFSVLAGLIVSLGCAKNPYPKPMPGGQVNRPAQAKADRVDTQAVLVVLRGEKVGIRYPIYKGKNYLGRADQQSVDIDFNDQEPIDRIWTSRQHAVITSENGKLVIEDLGSANGTFVNRHQVYPRKKQQLALGDILQLGTVVLKLVPKDDQSKKEEISTRKFRLVVLRGEKVGMIYPIYTGKNYLGRADELSVDIDLDDQEQSGWRSSRQHAVLTCQDDKLFVEDLKSANGTFVNRHRLFPGKRQELTLGDTVRTGTVLMKLVPSDYQEKVDAKDACKARLVVLHGLKIGTTYPIYEGANYIGRADELSVDVDLDPQEAKDRTRSSRQHAVATWSDGKLLIEDLESANGTFVNRERVKPGEKVPLKEKDVLQVGTVQLKVVPPR